jgi:L-aspartate oxidase
MNGPVYLSLRHLDEKEVKKTFPNIAKELKNYKLDLATDPIPITPVAHYSMGGVPTNLKGATEIKNFYAIGEVACTGMHGANRLASNSLLEAVVMAQSAAEAIKNAEPALELSEGELAAFQPSPMAVEPLPQVMAYARRLGQIMWEKVGILRTPSSLKEAQTEIVAIPARDYRIQHRQLVCYKIIEACLKREKSLGAHAMAADIQ